MCDKYAYRYAGTNNQGGTPEPDNPLKGVWNTMPRKLDIPLKGIRDLVPNGIQIQWPRGLNVQT